MLLIADDLTGAADACVAFVAHGLSGAVCFDTAAGVADVAVGVAGAAEAATDVIAFSTDTRAETSSIAAARVREVMARVYERFEWTFQTPDWTFKKIDSMLRGNTGVEIRAALDASRARVALVTPAFPALGRTVHHGMLRVEGRGAPTPIDVLARLALPGARAIRRGELSSALASGDRILVCDAVDQEDLDAIVEAGLAFGAEPLLWAGSAGLAHALARRVSGDVAARRGHARGLTGSSLASESSESSGPSEPSEPSGPSGPSGAILLAIGSNHPATVAQQEQLLQGDPPAACLALRDMPAIDDRLARGVDALVLLPPSAAEIDVARFAARLVARERPAPGGFIMSGGDTAARLCRHMQATRIDLRGEVSPGIPWGLLSVRSGGCWPLVLKSGGFGADDALQRARAFLRAHAGRMTNAHDEADTHER